MVFNNILVIQLRQLGDILLTTPCLRELRNENKNAKIIFLSHKMGKLVLDDNPYIDEHIVYHEDENLLEQIKVLKKIRQKKFDLVLDYMNNPRSALFTFFSGCKTRVSFTGNRSFVYSKVIEVSKDPTYIVNDKFLLLKEVGFKPSSTRLTLPWDEKHSAPYFQMIKTFPGFKDTKYRIALSPTHRRNNRKWPVERYAALADKLTVEWGAFVYWVWGPGSEESEIDSIMSLCKEKTFKAPKTSFRELAFLLGNTDLFIGNSNGPSHIAVANDICSLQLHGHTSIYSWCPLTEKSRAIQSIEYGKVGATLDSILLDDVLDELNKFKPVIEKYSEIRRANGDVLVGGTI